MFRNILSQFFIAKCLEKSLLIRILASVINMLVRSIMMLENVGMLSWFILNFQTLQEMFIKCKVG